MIAKLPESSGSVIGYAFSGAIDKDDYGVLVPEMESLVSQYGSVQLLCDLSAFTSERPSAWGDDLHFGKEFRSKISKMAIVGEHWYEGVITELAKPFYAQEAKHFTDRDAAWEWLRS